MEAKIEKKYDGRLLEGPLWDEENQRSWDPGKEFRRGRSRQISSRVGDVRRYLLRWSLYREIRD